MWPSKSLVYKCFLDINPDRNGHCLVIPKKHFKDINDIDLLLTNCHINNKNYQDMISYNVNIPNDLLPILENKYQVKVNNDIYIKSDM